MKARAFYDAVMAHPDLEWEGTSDNPPEVRVKDLNAGLTRGIGALSVLENDWARLEAVMTGKAPAKIMNWMSRVVGYFSRIQNWNKSKLAELRDRQAGSYTAPEDKRSQRAAWASH